MFSKPTAFVIGAGASAEADLPVGEALKKQIMLLAPTRDPSFIERHLSGDKLVFDALLLASRPPNCALDTQAFDARLTAANRVTTALPLAGSIDSLLESYAGDADMRLFGKLAIARAILAAESKSRLAQYGRLESSDKAEELVEDTWYPKLAKMIFDGRRPGDGPRIFENVAMICFNYDRCIETFFFNALRRYFSMDTDAARTAMSGLKIIRPYGKVGRLGWQPSPEDAVEFGAEISAQELLSLSSQIRIYTEEQQDGRTNAEVHTAMNIAHRVVFLGFGFHRQNLDLIRPPNGGKTASVVMTAFGISNYDLERAKQLAGYSVNYAHGFPDVLAPHSVTCKDLFFQLGLTLKN